MAGKNRDEFMESTKRVLALRANYRCSFPDCDTPTSGPSDESPESVTSIGIAAHIHAAAPGGRRYLESMEPEQRRHISNGIWLCANHSIEIDRDEMRYSPKVLHQMKEDHERKVSAQLSGTPQFGASGDLIAIGLGIVGTGEIIGTSGREWRLRLDHFLIGDLTTLINFSERFELTDPYDRFVLVNALGDGRQLSTTPTWKRSDSGYEITLQVQESFPRISAHKLGRDIALDFSINEKGDLATVAGLDALSQRIKIGLSTLRGQMPYNLTFGSRLKEYFDDFIGSPWLERLFKLEVIRLACIPYPDPISSQMYTPFNSVCRVRNIELLEEQSGHFLSIRFDLEVEGVGSWVREIPIFVPLGKFSVSPRPSPR